MIQTFHLTKQYKGRGGFVDISLSVKEGEVFSFLGKNGAGKSTFVRTLLGLLVADDGEGQLLGKPISEVEARRMVGYLPELFYFPDWLTGEELLVNHGALFGLKKADVSRKLPELLALIGMEGHEKKKIREYSKGMKQRIGLGCAVLPDTRLIFLDEPTSALDPVGRKHVRDIILKLKAMGRTVFLNTHLLSEAEMISDRIAIIDKGRLIKTGAIAELAASPVDVRCESLTEAAVQALFKNGWEPVVNADGFAVMLPEESVPELVNLLVNNGASVYQVNRRQNVLETMFIETVGGDDIR